MSSGMWHHVTVCGTMSLDVAPCHCMWHHVTVCGTVSLYVAPCHCMWHHVTLCVVPNISQEHIASSALSLDLSILKRKALQLFQTLQQHTHRQCRTREDLNVQQHYCKTLRSRITICFQLLYHKPNLEPSRQSSISYNSDKRLKSKDCITCHLLAVSEISYQLQTIVLSTAISCLKGKWVTAPYISEFY
jgi:hypothetical protein